MKPRGAAMSKPVWANVAESAKASKSDWAHRTGGPGSFQYTVKGFLAADERYCDDEVTVTITVSDDGATRCSEPGCKSASSSRCSSSSRRRKARQKSRAGSSAAPSERRCRSRQAKRA
jgi:hypothetical protein